MAHPHHEAARPGHELERPKHWLDQAIEDARKRGDFDNLPNTCQRLKLDPISIDSEWGLAATMMKNAGVTAPWVELSRQADAIEERMAQLRDDARCLHRKQVTERDSPVSTPPADAVSPPPLWRRIFRRKPGGTPRAGETLLPPSLTLDEQRSRARRRHAELAQELDDKIAEFHRRLPANLWRAQRLRHTVEEWNQRFDEACPPFENEHSS